MRHVGDVVEAGVVPRQLHAAFLGRDGVVRVPPPKVVRHRPLGVGVVVARLQAAPRDPAVAYRVVLVRKVGEPPPPLAS